MTVEQFGEQIVQLSSFLSVEAGQECVLYDIGVPLEFFEVRPADGGEADHVAPPIGGIGLPADLTVAFQAVEDPVDVIAVKAQTATDREPGSRSRRECHLTCAPS
ncbi:hypothetical protein ACGF5O_46650 [Streptomyces sp. NPDC048291]|uniref:hypothetical protein n=1 Tax=Streptomyces sp. NPDC048291 TaxID=3365530 RepID=UPI0037218581